MQTEAFASWSSSSCSCPARSQILLVAAALLLTCRAQREALSSWGFNSRTQQIPKSSAHLSAQQV